MAHERVQSEGGPAPRGATELPRVWVLLGQRSGDRSQMLGLAEALGWPYETRRLVYNRWHRLPNLLLGTTLKVLDRAASDPLEPPWPDLVIASAKRSVPVARWIRRAAGGRVRLIHVGRPWAPLGWFDLIVTTPQYRLPARPNLLQVTLPLHPLDPQRLAEARERFADRAAALPRPRVALLVGGGSWPFRLDAPTARTLGEAASRYAQRLGGSLLATTSGRTDPAAAEALAAALAGPVWLHRWRPDAPDNPYPGFLALADRFIVTGDSASMLSEACGTGKPVLIYDLPRRVPLQRRRAPGPLGQRLAELGILTPARDMAVLHAALIREGRATRFGEPDPPGGAPLIDDRVRVAERVRSLLKPSLKARFSRGS